jgi:hypothetical protein
LGAILLQVQPSQNAFWRARVIVLNKGQPNACLLVSFDLKGLFEKPSMIAKDLRAQ